MSLASAVACKSERQAKLYKFVDSSIVWRSLQLTLPLAWFCFDTNCWHAQGIGTHHAPSTLTFCCLLVGTQTV